ncbi:MAG: hypothetical protein LC796_10240 [Acidobacteria bacterium]|nr:hypothetical protein [Acidobacteriota bacterium]
MISPDGLRIVFGARDAEGADLLWVRSLDGNESRALNGTAGATYPFWSADGQSVGFFSDGMLKKIDTRDGVTGTLTTAPSGRGGTWNQEGTILFAPDSLSPLFRISSDGGKPVRVTDIGAGEPHLSHRWPSFLPDGRSFLYLVRAPGPNEPSYGVYLGSLDSSEAKRLLPESSNAIFAPPQSLLFVREGSLFATGFDLRDRTVRGKASRVAEDIYFHPYRWNGAFSVSLTGRLVYHAGASAKSSSLQWMERGGRMRETVGAKRDYAGIRLSPSGDRCAVEVHDSRLNTIEIWIQDLTRGSFERFSSVDAPINDSPVWSPDGRWIAFGSFRQGRWNLYRKSTAGSETEELLLGGGSDAVPTDWSPDGRSVLYWSRPGSEGQKRELWSIAAGESPKLYVRGSFNASAGRFSPDGRRVAYCSDETGREDVYVSPFPDPTSRVQISVAGGTQPVWRPDGQELFYLSPDNRLMSVPMESGDRAQPGKPERLFETSFRASPTDINVYDISRRTGLLLANVADPSATWGPLTVVVNWAPGSR